MILATEGKGNIRGTGEKGKRIQKWNFIFSLSSPFTPFDVSPICIFSVSFVFGYGFREIAK